MNRHGLQVLVPVPLGYLGGPRGGRMDSLEVAEVLLVHHHPNEQIAVLDAVGILAGQQALRAAEPPRGAARVPAERETQPRPEGAAHGAQRPAGVEMDVVGALERANVVVVAAQHVGGDGQLLEIVR